MSRKHSIPKYAYYKPRDCAAVMIDGQRVCLGEYNSPESRQKYEQIIAEWLLSKAKPPTPASPERVSVDQIIHAYWTWAKAHYRKCGEPVESQLAVIRAAFGPLRRLFGSLPATQFGKKQLKEVRAAMINAPCRRCQGTTEVERVHRLKRGGQPGRQPGRQTTRPTVKVACPRCQGTGVYGWSRSTVNKCVSIIRQAWRWACEDDMIPDHLWQSLMVVKPLERDRDGVRPDPEDIQPVDNDTVERTIEQLNPVVADMVRVQRLALMRPCEVRGMRAQDIDRDGRLPDGEVLEKIWVYTVPDRFNKLAHKGIRRTVLLGPKAQRILAPYIARRPQGFLFSPKEAAERWLEEQGGTLPATHKRPPGDFYPKRAYSHAITRAAKRAGVAPWGANRLRHSGISEWRERSDLKTAGDAAGHHHLETTKRYTKIELQRAADQARRLG